MHMTKTMYNSSISTCLLFIYFNFTSNLSIIDLYDYLDSLPINTKTQNNKDKKDLMKLYKQKLNSNDINNKLLPFEL